MRWDWCKLGWCLYVVLMPPTVFAGLCCRMLLWSQWSRLRCRVGIRWPSLWPAVGIEFVRWYYAQAGRRLVLSAGIRWGLSIRGCIQLAWTACRYGWEGILVGNSHIAVYHLSCTMLLLQRSKSVLRFLSWGLCCWQVEVVFGGGLCHRVWTSQTPNHPVLELCRFQQWDCVLYLW